jgi:hypothetical protein
MKKLLLLLLLLVSLTISCEKDEFLEECNIDLNPSDVYVYPLRPGMPEWANLTPEQFLEVTQMPEKTARKMSTDGLIQSWLDYPLNLNISLNNSWSKAMDFSKANFNGLAELLNRKSAGCKILERFKAYDLTKFQTPIERTALVALVGYFDVLQHMNDEQLREVVRESLSKHDYLIAEQPDYYSLSTVQGILWPAARVMYYLEYEPLLEDMKKSEELMFYVQRGAPPLPNGYGGFEFQSIIQNAKNFLK